MKRNSNDPVIIEKILMYRIKGYSFEMIGRILHLTRQRIYQIFKKNKDKKEYKKLYEEVTKTKKFLEREIK